MRLDIRDVTLHPSSFVDPNGRLFFWNGRLFRALTEEAARRYWDLKSRGVIARSMEAGILVETSETEFELAPFRAVLEHRRLPFVSYPYEWCPSMLKAAASVTVQFLEEIWHHGYELQDGHGLNVLFEGCRPQFIDLGSIVSRTINREWMALEEFRNNFLHPLRLSACGHGRIARALLMGYRQGISISEIGHYIGREALTVRFRKKTASWARKCLPTPAKVLIRRILERRAARTYESLPERLRSVIDNTKVEPISSDWLNYYDRSTHDGYKDDSWTAKAELVSTLLRRLRPSKVLDIGANTGFYSRLAASTDAAVVAIDSDVACIENLYRDGAAHGYNILPLVMDLTNPSPAVGPGNAYCSEASARLRCELVLALALVHHLVFTHLLDFKRIADTLAAFTEKWLIVEFVPREDPYVARWCGPQHDWYVEDKFVAELNRQFATVQRYSLLPSARAIYLCSK